MLLLQARKKDYVNQLKLTLAWNQLELAQERIFSQDHRWSRGIFNEVAHTALALNRVQFIKIFLHYGLRLNEFLSIAELTLLYNNVCFPSF